MPQKYYSNEFYFISVQYMNINRLQRVQNILARVVAGAPGTVSSLDIRRDLHWLPVSHRINF